MSATATIRARRDALGLTQKTAAKLAGVNEQTWHRFETGSKPIANILAARCMRLLNGEIKIPKGTPRKHSPAECTALAENPHRFTTAEARAAGRKGGEVAAAKPGYMANLGRKGGAAPRRKEQP